MCASCIAQAMAKRPRSVHPLWQAAAAVLVLCALLSGCGYTWRGQEGSRSETSVLGDGTKTLKIKEIEQTTLFSWLPYMTRSLLRDDITERGLAKWVDEGPADYTITVRIPSFQIRSYGQYQDSSQLFTGNMNMQLILYDGRTNTEVWQSGPLYYSDNFENANEEQAIREILQMAIRRAVDRLQQKF